MTFLKRTVYILAALYVLLNAYNFVMDPNPGYGGAFAGSLFGSALLAAIAKKGADFYALHRGTFRGYLVAGIVAVLSLIACGGIVQLVTDGKVG
jgi:hypothetical protein